MELNKSSIEHIFFDLDHTLWDFDTNSRVAINQMFLEFELVSLGFTPDEYFPVYKRCNEYCWSQYRKNLMNKDLLRHQRFFLSLKDFGVVDRQLAKKLGKRYVDISPNQTALMPGTKEILEYLHPKYKMHIITNGFQEIQFLKMKNTGIDKYFTKIITSERAGKRKPEPRIFQYALKQAECTPDQAIMIGDDLDADIHGAINYGIRAIWFNYSKLENAANLEYVHHLDDLRNFL